MPTTINRLLIANRGEIASRIIRTCKDMGISTVAVFSDPDAAAPFVQEADLAVALGGATPAESYLRGSAIVDAAVRTGADAIHPGYGFLSENAEFAAMCEDAGLVFIGPSPHVIESMGSKLAAREIVANAGGPVLHGVDITGLDDGAIITAADTIGWPVLVKASYGGGGRGMRVVRLGGDLLDAVSSARREAHAAFGNDTLFLERYVDEPRHVEIQIFGDHSGRVVSLHERECSIQRRHQKIIEECPSPAVDAELRARMGAAAVAVGHAIGYVGAGTVEFLLDNSGEFHFLEVNTRLQVEHPVTEMVTGLDLVRLQILVAEGELIPAELDVPGLDGHAIEVRLYAEDPRENFMPSAGRLDRFRIPTGSGIRVDSGFADGSEVSTHYDPMLAKVIAHGATRSEAARRLAAALENAELFGVRTNRDLLVAILREPEFLAGQIDTHYLERHTPADLTTHSVDPHLERISALAVALAAQATRRREAVRVADIQSGFRNAASGLQHQAYMSGDTTIDVGYALGRNPQYEIDGEPVADIEVLSVTESEVRISLDGICRTFAVSRFDSACYVTTPGATVVLREVPRFPRIEPVQDAGSLSAPMPGNVIRIGVAVGDTVTKGQLLVVIEAMKMEHSITASGGGSVTDVRVEIGDGVHAGQTLIVLDVLDPIDVPDDGR